MKIAALFLLCVSLFGQVPARHAPMECYRGDWLVTVNGARWMCTSGNWSPLRSHGVPDESTVNEVKTLRYGLSLVCGILSLLVLILLSVQNSLRARIMVLENVADDEVN